MTDKVKVLPDYMTLADVKNRLSEVVNDVERTNHRITITKRGLPAAVILAFNDYEGLLETLDIMSDPEDYAKTLAGLAEARAGEGEVLTKEEALKRWGSQSA